MHAHSNVCMHIRISICWLDIYAYIYASHTLNSKVCWAAFNSSRRKSINSGDAETTVHSSEINPCTYNCQDTRC